jgi:thiol-disulfide isomerase/thioredoxin
MKKVFVLLLSSVFITGLSFAQQQTTNSPQDFSITVTLDGAQAGDTVLLQAYRPRREVIETALTQEGGKCTFHSDTLLSAGMYSIGLGNFAFDFFISDGAPQVFSIQHNINESLASVRFTGSPENQAWIDYIRFIQEKQMQRQQLQQRTQANAERIDSMALINAQIETLNREVKSKWAEIESAFSGKMLALFISSIREVEPPPFTVPDTVANQDSVYREHYFAFFREHFFDNYQFSSPYLLRMPFYTQALNTYFTRLVKFERLETTGRIAWLLEKLEENKPLYRYTARELYELYKNVPYPELEGLYLYIGETYITGKPEMWDDAAYIERVERAIQVAKMNPVGEKTTDLKLNDLAGNAVSLYDVQAAYTVLYFYNPECGACAEITPKVHAAYQTCKGKGIQVFAVYIDRARDVWMNYVVENKYLDWVNVWDADETADIYGKYDLHAIPMIYLLDKDKVVIERDLDPNKLELWLSQLTVAE